MVNETIDLVSDDSVIVMTPSTKPIAPYLPADIIFRIINYLLESIPNGNTLERERILMRVSTINNEWRCEVQRRLFQEIKINTLTRRDKLVEFRFSSIMLIIKSLTIDYSNYPLVWSESTSLLLQSVPNLEILNITISTYFYFSPEQTRILKDKIYLPNLSTLRINFIPYLNGNKSRSTLDTILCTCPVLNTLEITGPVSSK